MRSFQQVCAHTSYSVCALTPRAAVHVSRDGKDLVTQLSDSRMVVIRDFARVIRGEISIREAALEIGKTIPRLGNSDEHFSIYLSYENGRLGVVTVRNLHPLRSEYHHAQSVQTSGIYAATLDPTYHGLLDADLVNAGKKEVFKIPMEAVQKGISFPYITFVSMPFYHDRRQLSKVTCIQITETKLYFVWDAMYKPDNIDYFRLLGMIGGNTPPPPDGDNDDMEDNDGDDLAEGLFTTEATVAAAQAAGAQVMVDSEGDEDWDTQDVAESHTLVASGSGTAAEDAAGAGPSTAGAAIHAADDDDNDDNNDDDDDWDYDDDDSVGSDGDDPPEPQHTLIDLGRSRKWSDIHVSLTEDLTVLLVLRQCCFNRSDCILHRLQPAVTRLIYVLRHHAETKRVFKTVRFVRSQWSGRICVVC